MIINYNQNDLGLDQYLKISEKAYKADLLNILKDRPVIPLGRENCSHCDQRFKLIFSPEKSRINLLLEKQISFQSNKIEFRRMFKQIYKYLNTFEKESKNQTIRIAKRITNYQNILDELDYRMESDIRSKKLYFCQTI